jgi:hypothetical protein
MKKLLLFSSLFVVLATNTVFAQVAKRVLVEEFTNTGCPPCAISDPFMHEFEGANVEKIVTLKFHTQGPDPSDPYYNSNKTDANPRADYYSVAGVPSVHFDGGAAHNPTTGVAPIQAKFDAALAEMETSPFEIGINQEIIGDSIIATVTVKAVGDVPSESDLRVACVFGERFNKFTGSNGMPSYDYIVRKTLPGISSSTGEIIATTDYPNLVITKGATKTLRFAHLIPPGTKSTDWNRPQLFTAAFIQGVSSHTVYQANWTLPNISVEQPDAKALIIPSSSPLTYKVNNLGTTPVTLKAKYTGTGIASDWNIAVAGVGADGSFEVPAGGSANVTVNSTAATDILGAKKFSLTFTRADELHIDEATAIAWGKANRDIVVDAGGGTANCNTIANAIKAGSEYTNSTLVVSLADFEPSFDSWSDFRTILYIGGTRAGLYTDDNSWVKLEPYLNNGGHFLLSSTVAVNAYASTNNEFLFDLWRTNFGIEPTEYDASSSWGELTGVVNDEMTNGLSTTISGVSTTQELTTTADGIPCLVNENLQPVGTRAKIGDGKSVFLTFGINNVKTADRNAFAKRIMDWFAGAASVKKSDNASTISVSNFPNPAQKLTTFTYSLTERSLVTLSVYDVMGREVASILTNQMQDKGTYESDLDVSKFATGSYIYKMNVGGKMLSGTLNVVK